jgi:hypothetical protein
MYASLHSVNSEPLAFSYGEAANSFSPAQPEENDFNDFEEDETAKRIREEEDRIQNLLRDKSVAYD